MSRGFGWGFSCGRCGESGSGPPGTEPQTCRCAAAKARGAFITLAQLGLAIAAGQVLRFAERRAQGKHSPEYLSRKGGSCDACTEAGIIAGFARGALLGTGEPLTIELSWVTR